jgi:DNA-binding NtrC family response regulator
VSHERILIVEDEKLIRWAIKARLEQDGYTVVEAEDGRRTFAALAERDADLVILDFKLPDQSGLDVLERLRREAPDVSVLMMTAFGTVESAVQAMKLGAFDYLTKPVNLDELVLIVQKALETTRLRREVHRLRSERREVQDRVRLIGTSPPWTAVLELVGKICRSQATTVLIEGESGTGKNVVAKAIHHGSPRAERPFMNITCSALTETLLESELFGHERGAFTDAKTQKKGLLEVADGGTVFLDEIGEMGPAMQVKLLRFLEEKTFRRVGGTREILVDVRIVAATNRDLERAVQNAEFRGDLFYRLKVIPIRLPPLRERTADIPPLVEHFLAEFNQEFHKRTTAVSPEAMARLCAYEWPGNVRELRNVIERIMILEDKERIETDDLPRALLAARAGAAPAGAATLPIGSMTLEEMERRAIDQALEQAGRNQVQAAKILGISRDTLRYRMKKFGMLDDAPAGAGPGDD